MRGKACGLQVLGQPVGITPAYAGKSPMVACTCDIEEDHPRLCGEKQLAADDHRQHRGSPPPMRGKGIFGMVQTI